MAEEKKQDDSKDTSASREERMERIQHLIRDRGEDAAKMVKTWLHKTQDQRR